MGGTGQFGAGTGGGAAGEAARLRAAVAALEAQREVLGPEALEAALAPLRARLAVLAGAEAQGGRGAGERRPMGGLFGDLSGFTTLAERADPEAVAEMLSELWGELDGIVQRLGGTVDKHIGDALMAWWGTRGTAERAAALALEAALAMQVAVGAFVARGRLRALGEAAPGKPVGMRIGVHAGLAFVGEVGARGERTALGDTVNTASRLQALAPVGGVLASEEVLAQARGLFDVEAAGTLAVRGRSAPVTAVRVLRRRPPQFVDPSRGLARDLPMVGRQQELAQVAGALAGAALGEVRRVLLCGEPGIGKSRMVQEVARLLPEGALVARARAQPEAAGSPFALLRELLLSAVGGAQDDAPALLLQHLLGATHGRLGEAGAREALALAGVGGLVPGEGQGGAPPEAAGGPLGLLGRTLAALAPGGRSAVLLLEDLHWADAPSLEVLLAHLVAWPQSGLVLLCTARPWPADGGSPLARVAAGRPAAFDLRVDLQPLADGEATRLARLLAGPAPSPAGLEALVARAGGNPLFLEELVDAARGATHAGAAPAGAGTPATLRGVLQARLDQLAPERLQVLRLGSVLGEAFWDAGVVALGGGPREAVAAALEALEAEGLLLAQPASAFGAARELRFRHALLREAAYEGTRLKERRRAHAAAAGWLEQVVGAALPAWAGVIAGHCEAAGEGERAARHHAAAGEYALARSAFREAVGAFRRGTALAGEAPAALRARLALGEGSGLEKLARYDEAVPRIEEALARAGAAGDLALASRATGLLSWVVQLQGDEARARALGQRALELARQSGDRATLARALSRVAPEQPGAPLEVRMQPRREARALFRALGDRPGEAISLLNLGNMAFLEGAHAQAGGFYEESLALYRDLGNRWGVANCQMNLGLVHLAAGRPAEALRVFHEAMALSAAIGDREGIALGHENIAQAQVALGQPAEALGALRQALAEALDIGLGATLPSTLSRLAGLHAAAGRWPQAATLAEAVLAAQPGAEERERAAAALAAATAALAPPALEAARRAALGRTLAELAALEAQGVVPPGRALVAAAGGVA
ncbi:MAG: ATP-binding protein [Planctomycetia bacterium]